MRAIVLVMRRLILGDRVPAASPLLEFVHPVNVTLAGGVGAGRLSGCREGTLCVRAVDPRTGARTVLANGLALSLEGLDLPRDTNAGIVVDSDGAIYVSCPGDNSIIRIAARGDTEPGEYVK